MPVYRLTIARNHLLAELPNGFALIDTGAPVSYGGGPPLVMRLRGPAWCVPHSGTAGRVS